MRERTDRRRAAPLQNLQLQQSPAQLSVKVKHVVLGIIGLEGPAEYSSPIHARAHVRAKRGREGVSCSKKLLRTFGLGTNYLVIGSRSRRLFNQLS